MMREARKEAESIFAYTGAERRRSPRVSDGVKAKIYDRDAGETASVVNISQHGTLLRTD